METTEELTGTERITFIDRCNKIFKDRIDKYKLPFDDWEIYTVQLNNKEYDIKYTDKDGNPFRFIKCKGNDDNDSPNLVAWAGVSLKSFCNTSRIIMNNIESLKNCYQAIYIICLENIKDIQLECFPSRDAKNKASTITGSEDDRELTFESKKYKLTDPAENYEWIAFKNENEISFQEKSSYIFDKIIRAIKLENNHKLENVHILGKSAGAGIAIHIMNKDNIYTGLFLAVPSSPLNVQLLRELPKERLQKIKFRFMWIEEDAMAFDWQRDRLQKIKFRIEEDAMIFDWQKDRGIDLEHKQRNTYEKNVYDSEMKSIKEKLSDNKLDYKSYIYNGIESGPNETKSCSPGHHEVHKDFLETLCDSFIDDL